MEIAREIIDSTDWSQYELLGGSAAGFGDFLQAFIVGDPAKSRAQLWATMENHVFAQDDIFSAVEPALRVLLAAIADGTDENARHSILDLIFHIVQAASYRGDALGARCVADAAAGTWLLVREAVEGDENLAESCIEILEIVDPDYATLVVEVRSKQ